MVKLTNRSIDRQTHKCAGGCYLEEALQKFLEVKNIREDTQKNYRYLITGHLEDWLAIAITSITKDMVEQRHRELTEILTRSGTPSWTSKQRDEMFERFDQFRIRQVRIEDEDSDEEGISYLEMHCNRKPTVGHYQRYHMSLTAIRGWARDTPAK